MRNEIFEKIKKKYEKTKKFSYVQQDSFYVDKSFFEDMGKLIQIIEIKRDYVSKKKLNKKNEYNESVGIVLNLIRKQSKEIEELKQDRDEYKEEYIKLQNARYYNYISKDEIKAKIEDILNSENSEAIEKLIEWQSVLEKE